LFEEQVDQLAGHELLVEDLVKVEMVGWGVEQHFALFVTTAQQIVEMVVIGRDEEFG
jgi:hypothetical protein